MRCVRNVFGLTTTTLVVVFSFTSQAFGKPDGGSATTSKLENDSPKKAKMISQNQVRLTKCS